VIYRNCVRGVIGAMSLLLVWGWGQAVMSQALPQVRVLAAVKSEQKVAVAGTTSPYLARSVEMGRVPGGQNLGRMILQLTVTEAQENAAQKLVSDLHDPSSPWFHKWLTPAEYGQEFGVADADATKVRQWLESQGLTVHEVAQSRRFIVFSGTVSQVENAFATQMHSYEYKSKKFIANSTDIQIPVALQPVVKGVVRLHTDPRSSNAFLGTKVHFKKKGSHFTFDDGSHYLAPADFAKIYNVQPLYDAGIDGTGQTIAIVGRSNINVQDVRDFRSLLGLPENDPEVIVNGDDPGETLSDIPEAILDVTWSGAVAPMAQIKFVVSQSNFADGVDVSAAYIVDHNLAPVVSTSYGSCEDSLGTVENAFYNSLWKQAAAEGITSFVSSGDNGGAGCDSPGSGLFASGGLAVNGISSTPYNVSVGGTQFDDTDNPEAYWSSNLESDPATGLSALGYIPEKVWNESSSDPTAVGLWAASGGVSKVYTKPDWQAAAGVPNDGKRDIPDISLTAAAHDGYLVCLYGYCSFGDYFFAFGGTSASSPAAAGIMALVNQKLGGQRQGIANYVLYKLALIPGVYHDTTKGDNKVPDEFGQHTLGYSAGTGYDLASGLGSFDATALVNNWQTAATAIGSATTLALGAGQSTTVMHGAPITVRTTVACSNGSSCTAPAGAVSLLATSSTGDSLGSGIGQLTAGTHTSTATIQTHTVPGGAMTITARYGGDSKYYASTSGPVNVTVTPEPTQTYVGMISGGYINDAPLSIQYGQPIPLGVAVAGNSGYGYPSGGIDLIADGASIQPSKYDYAAGIWSPYPIVLNYGEKSTLFTSGSNPTSQSSSVFNLTPGLAAGQHELSASYPGDKSFGGSSGSYAFTVTKSDSTIVDFFPLGTPVVGVPVHLAGQLALPNYACADYGGTMTFTDLTTGAPQVLTTGPVSTLYCSSYDIPVTFTTGGMHIIRADYSGDSNVNGSTQTYRNFPVSVTADSYTTLSADIPRATVGSTFTLTANVSSDVRQHAPTGTVTFLDGAAAIGIASVDPTGNAVLAIKSLAAGPHNITANYGGDSALNSSTAPPVALQVTDYTVQVFPATVFLHAGSTGTASFNVVPLGGFNQSVQFSCGTLPAKVSCSFNMSSVTLDGVNPTVVTLTVATNRIMASTAGTTRCGGALLTGFALASLLLPVGMRKKWKSAFTAVCLLGLVLWGIGCGSSNNSSNAQAGTYTVSVTATSGTGAGAMTKTTPLTVTVVN
jgi:Pro-kumamolisin, activation domain/Bacterial Ig-like domain (group 3)